MPPVLHPKIFLPPPPPPPPANQQESSLGTGGGGEVQAQRRGEIRERDTQIRGDFLNFKADPETHTL
jgi:hypothetical protein